MHTNSHGSKLVDCSCPVREYQPILTCRVRLSANDPGSLRPSDRVDSTFAGQLQSDVRCGSCGEITSAFDPMLDISLDLKTKAGVVADGENTLAKSLRRYTSPEKLGQSYLCDKCGVSSLVSRNISPPGLEGRPSLTTNLLLALHRTQRSSCPSINYHQCSASSSRSVSSVLFQRASILDLFLT